MMTFVWAPSLIVAAPPVVAVVLPPTVLVLPPRCVALLFGKPVPPAVPMVLCYLLLFLPEPASNLNRKGRSMDGRLVQAARQAAQQPD